MKMTWFGVLTLTLVFLAGCSKINTENYDKLEMGMAYEEVVSLLGKADHCEGAMGLKDCMWGDDAKHIKISFAADKVVIYSGKGL